MIAVACSVVPRDLLTRPRHDDSERHIQPAANWIFWRPRGDLSATVGSFVSPVLLMWETESIWEGERGVIDPTERRRSEQAFAGSNTTTWFAG